MAQIGTVKVQTPSGTVSVPVFEVSDIGTEVLSSVKVQTPSGVGVIPFIDPQDATYPYLKVQTPSGVKSAHDQATLSQAIEVTASLNGGTATLIVYEDVDGDGEFDNREILALSDGNNGYTPSNLTRTAGNDYWLRLETDNATEEDTVEVTSVIINETQ